MTPPFRKILVANRGEIALRVFRTCAERGIATVAVYSDADRDALHTTMADESVHIGAAPAAESYLRVERILAAAKATGAEAIHPGYGFLSERAYFVEACKEAGVVFIGPSAHAMNVMGDKAGARKAMREAGVPVVPGFDDIADAEQAEAAAREIGFPVMLKASAGGGGKGMRIVHEASELRRAYEGAAREAKASFGDDRMLMERAVLSARHVEIQLMADQFGETVYLNERDCSVQRRHQKVIEESPSPSPQMTPAVRQAMGEVAVRAAKAVDYTGAGTVEFLFEETAKGPRFYFLEMNTRLQVEHPVTEATCGRDLVWDQIRVAAGQPLGYTQADVELRGHAVECRVYAEDPRKFLPSPGLVRLVRWPVGANIRIDTAVASGSVVSRFYDPMIAKITTWGPDRAAALARMREALRETVVLGIETNLAFHLRCLDEPDFLAGDFSTRYIDKHPDLVAEHVPSEADARAIAAAAAVRAAESLSRGASTQGGEADVSAWRRSARWRG
ncbi:acetyl-CoA carboxylase biotin carboxylase subunit [Nannocystis sp. RBIL2]|uniref:acetyl-CoA carboxylase biotin carboxylase subunit n=1 Tax=Nannocystis sp. RBIL2 TaxID=2996788 RepID=UPI002270C5D5|nr:acetyl-CoA carboxylase biotin carboxylase subunit [Nannocystis sp. RBIL2]MCY1069619.1 acetyl-CoA carboxylase biotin carboxylase subunit [Nannocystis sp. RBIL2]